MTKTRSAAPVADFSPFAIAGAGDFAPSVTVEDIAESKRRAKMSEEERERERTGGIFS